MVLSIQLACLAGTLANMYDVVLPNYRSSCINGCLAWSDAARSLPPSANLSQSDINDMFIKGGGSVDAKDHCAMPGARAGTHEKDCGIHCTPDADQWRYVYDSYAGPWCFCKDPVRKWTFLFSYFSGLPEVSIEIEGARRSCSICINSHRLSTHTLSPVFAGGWGRKQLAILHAAHVHPGADQSAVRFVHSGRRRLCHLRARERHNGTASGKVAPIPIPFSLRWAGSTKSVGGGRRRCDWSYPPIRSTWSVAQVSLENFHFIVLHFKWTLTNLRGNWRS
jgi:hypothetical protein